MKLFKLQRSETFPHIISSKLYMRNKKYAFEFDIKYNSCYLDTAWFGSLEITPTIIY
ncbi:MAG: hypothetical protein ACRCX2_04545 [Paraclostridium sp.]